jgi:DNA-binding GntR family transcriptional regulator
VRNVTQAAHLDDNLIDTRNLSDRVYDYLTDKILEGSIAYGEKMNPKLIAEKLNISITPVRDAIKRLEVEGIITVHPRSNSAVKMPTRSSMLDAFEMREMFEKYALEKIYTSMTPEDLDNMKLYIKQMDTCLPINNVESRMAEYVKYDQLFHQEFCILAGNINLLKMYRTNMLQLNIAMTFRAGIEPDMEQVNRDHRMIFEHLLRNSHKAIEVLMRHLNQCRLNMIEGQLFKSFP